MDDLTPNKIFSAPIVKTTIKLKKRKKEYQQYSIRLPKKLINMMDIREGNKFIFELLPINENEKYPKMNVWVEKHEKY